MKNLILIAIATVVGTSSFASEKSKMKVVDSTGAFAGVSSAIVTLHELNGKPEAIEIQYKGNKWLEAAESEFRNEFEVNAQPLIDNTDVLKIVNQYQDECRSTVYEGELVRFGELRARKTVVLFDHRSRGTDCEDRVLGRWESRVVDSATGDSVLEMIGNP